MDKCGWCNLSGEDKQFQVYESRSWSVNSGFNVNQQRQLGVKDLFRHEVVEIDAISVMGMVDVFR